MSSGSPGSGISVLFGDRFEICPRKRFLLATLLPCPYQTVIIKYGDGKEEKTTVSYHALPVKLPGEAHPLFFVVVKRFGKAPMMLLTSCLVNIKSKESIGRIVESYLARWKCDASFRHIKQRYNLEDIRVRHDTSIRNVVVLILAVATLRQYVSETL